DCLPTEVSCTDLLKTHDKTRVTVYTAIDFQTVESVAVQWRDEVNKTTYVHDYGKDKIEGGSDDSFIKQEDLGKDCLPTEVSCTDLLKTHDKTRVTVYTALDFQTVESVAVQWRDEVNKTTYVHDYGKDKIEGGSDDSFIKQEDLGKDCLPTEPVCTDALKLYDKTRVTVYTTIDFQTVESV